MQVIKSLFELKKYRQNLTGPVGFVATMGCLHDGHGALIQRSVAENDYTIVSIFVNPTQFNNSSDLNSYPITLDADIELASKHHADIIFIPDADDMYPHNYNFNVMTADPLSQLYEGEYRPGHFDGVLSVVLKLLNLTKPQNAYFGEKDIQQYVLIKRMVESFFIDTNIVMCSTVRETSGLALSSRNARLSDAQRQRADLFAKTFHSGVRMSEMKQQLTENNITVDYIERHDDRLLAAVNIDDIRLIDNILIAD
jgi:pantoate--beta-alanine ligase